MHDAAHMAEFTLIASEDGVRLGLQQVRAFLEASGLGEDACGTAEIVLAEALNNVAEHAYQMRGVGDIDLTVGVDPDGIDFDIRDTGVAMPGLILPTGQLPAMDGPLDSMPEGGFGWFLIHSQTDILTYQREDGQNHLHMHLPRDGEVGGKDAHAL